METERNEFLGLANAKLSFATVELACKPEEIAIINLVATR